MNSFNSDERFFINKCERVFTVINYISTCACVRMCKRKASFPFHYNKKSWLRVKLKTKKKHIRTKIS